MGLRNPSRMAIDPETDVPYAAWVGPDAGSPSATQGPSTYETATQLPTAGNYGWPYCMGNKQPYRDRVADGSLRTTNVAGYVNGGPAASPTPGWYDCNNLVNDSTNNTGLVTLPHTTGTGKDAGTAHSNNVWYSRGNPSNANGCPDFPREQGANNAPNYGGHADAAVPVPDRLRRDGVHRPGLPLQVGRGQLRALAQVLGRPLVPQRLRQQQRQARAAAGSRRRTRTAPSRSTRTASAASSRGARTTWTRSSGPDGALYVQVYEGFFTTGSGAGLYRFTYTGGADTPGPDPQWQSTATARQVQFSIGASGGVSYEWDFGDGTRRPAGTNPTHTYAAPGTYSAKLTVTYADGEKATKTVERAGQRRRAAPTTTVQLNDATPAATYTAAGQGHAARERRRRRRRRRVDRVPDRRRRLDASRQHRQRLAVRDRVHGRRRGLPHGRVPLARSRRQRRDARPGRSRSRSTSPAAATAAARRSRISSTARRSTRSGRSSTRSPATRRPWAAGV